MNNERSFELRRRKGSLFSKRGVDMGVEFRDNPVSSSGRNIHEGYLKFKEE